MKGDRYPCRQLEHLDVEQILALYQSGHSGTVGSDEVGREILLRLSAVAVIPSCVLL